MRYIFKYRKKNLVSFSLVRMAQTTNTNRFMADHDFVLSHLSAQIIEELGTIEVYFHFFMYLTQRMIIKSRRQIQIYRNIMNTVQSCLNMIHCIYDTVVLCIK